MSILGRITIDAANDKREKVCAVLHPIFEKPNCKIMFLENLLSHDANIFFKYLKNVGFISRLLKK